MELDSLSIVKETPFHERDFLFNRIVNGYFNISYKDKKYKVLEKYDIELIYESSEIYKETYDMAKEDNLIDEDELYIFLCENCGWSDDEEKRLNIDIPKYLDDVKVEMYKNYLKDGYIKKAMKYINRVNEEFEKLYNQRHQFDYLTCHGAALFAEYQYLIENSVYIKKEKQSLSPKDLSFFMNKNNENRISEETVRELSRTDPFKNIWSISKKIDIFKCSAVELSENQRKIIQWAAMYDTIYENPECPPEVVMSNDYLLDGWLILRRKESALDKKRSEIEKRVGNKNGNEIFIVAQSDNDAKDILDMNAPDTRQIVKNRLAIIEKHNDIEITDENFPDVQRDIMIRHNNALRR